MTLAEGLSKSEINGERRKEFQGFQSSMEDLTTYNRKNIKGLHVELLTVHLTTFECLTPPKVQKNRNKHSRSLYVKYCQVSTQPIEKSYFDICGV